LRMCVAHSINTNAIGISLNVYIFRIRQHSNCRCRCPVDESKLAMRLRLLRVHLHRGDLCSCDGNLPGVRRILRQRICSIAASADRLDAVVRAPVWALSLKGGWRRWRLDKDPHRRSVVVLEGTGPRVVHAGTGSELPTPLAAVLVEGSTAAGDPLDAQGGHSVVGELVDPHGGGRLEGTCPALTIHVLVHSGTARAWWRRGREQWWWRRSRGRRQQGW